MVTKRTDSLTPQHGGVLTIKVEATAKLPLNRVPVSGLEPTARRLQEVRPCAPYALAATMARATALTDSLALELSDAAFHESFHANGPATVHGRIRP